MFLSKILDENSLLIFLLVNYKKLFSIQCFFFSCDIHACIFVCVSLWLGLELEIYDRGAGNMMVMFNILTDSITFIFLFIYKKDIYIYCFWVWTSLEIKTRRKSLPWCLGQRLPWHEVFLANPTLLFKGKELMKNKTNYTNDKLQ